MFRSAFASPPQHTLKLYYFPLRGRAEFIRLMLHYLGLNFEDRRIRKDEWQNFKSRTPMSQLPVLEVDGKMLGQATAIGRFIAKEYGLAGKGSLEMAQADMLVDGVFDCWEHLQAVYKDQQKGDIQLMIQSWAQFYERHLKQFLDQYQELLKKSRSDWFVGDSGTWADFAVAEFLAVIRDCFTSDALDSYSLLVGYMEKILSLPNVQQYIEKRERVPF